MSISSLSILWKSWVHHPQRLSFRKVVFQIHLWSGISLGLYIFFISITGSVLVYRNELYVVFTPEPFISTAPGPTLSDEQLTEDALSLHLGYTLTRINRPRNPKHAVIVSLKRKDKTIKRLFDPRSGDDVGAAIPTGVAMTSALIRLHKDFLAGPNGRRLNGIIALAVLLVVLTGFVLWWPGIKRWRRSLMTHRNVGWRRINWDIHSMIGFWSYGFILIFTVSGIYLCFPETFHNIAELIQPMTAENAGNRLVDTVLYWLAFLHFGRINGIGLPCSGPGICDQSVKAVWALFGLAPALMFMTGVTMWWNRVLRRWSGKNRQ